MNEPPLGYSQIMQMMKFLAMLVAVLFSALATLVLFEIIRHYCHTRDGRPTTASRLMPMVGIVTAACVGVAVLLFLKRGCT